MAAPNHKAQKKIQQGILRDLIHSLANQIAAVTGYFGLEASLHIKEKRPFEREKAAAILAVNKSIKLLEKIRAVLLLMEDDE